ncbi:MAG: ATP-binding cassette domain-containing protein [Deltaproteobacteria bacterium]|nr:ATP-binding cassette domain-containing protein [Deltaproteobacteria bacterium]
MASVLIDIRKLEKTYPLGGGMLKGRSRIVRAVDGIDLTVMEGETLGLVGESGCGKSTLARLLMRLEKPDGGEIVFRGRDISSLSPEEMKTYRRRVQMIFQDPYSSLNPRKTALGIIREPLDIHRIAGRKQNRETAAELMTRVGLSGEQAGRYPHEFSGGQRQRIGIARALTLRPQLVIADEPVSALDASIQAQILNLLKDLKKDFGLTYLFISHDLNVIRHVSDRIAVMYLGRIVELAEKDDLYRKPFHPYTRMLLAAMPSCDPGRSGQTVTIRGEAAKSDEEGCNFKNRCAYRIDMCDRVAPQLKAISERSRCACHRAGEI